LRPTTAPARSWTEYFFESVKSPEKGNPSFNGGDAFISWLPTGEVRVYNTRAGFFDQISPLRPYSAVDLEPGNWSVGSLHKPQQRPGTRRQVLEDHAGGELALSDNVRLGFIYGYGSLNRFDLVGKTQFFQTRIQLQF